MPDLENWMKGDLADRPFSALLFYLWQSEKTGFLRVEQGDLAKTLGFKDGYLTVTIQTLPQKDFLRDLVEKNIIDSALLTKCEQYAEQNICSLLKALHELSALRPSETWPLLEKFIQNDAFSLFDWDEGRYEFVPEAGPHDAQILFSIPIHPLILQGIRRMKNHKAIEARIPEEGVPIQVLTPYYFNQIILEPAERYLLNLLKRQTLLKTFYETSELGKKESQKILFAFLSLGLISPAPEKPDKSHRSTPEPLEFDKKWAVFNSKFSYIYKYVSKELGPVAFNLIEKCFEELKPHLSPFWKQGKFDSEGRISLNAILKIDIAFANAETKRALIRDLNEILMAEVLAVKKNLGDEHESLLVSHLNRMGEAV